MWLAVIFDLPTRTVEERRSAGRFRRKLLKAGFSMHQESFYLRHIDSEDAADFKIMRIAPGKVCSGKITILKIGDAAWERCLFYNSGKRAPPGSTESFLLL